MRIIERKSRIILNKRENSFCSLVRKWFSCTFVSE